MLSCLSQLQSGAPHAKIIPVDAGPRPDLQKDCLRVQSIYQSY